MIHTFSKWLLCFFLSVLAPLSGFATGGGNGVGNGGDVIQCRTDQSNSLAGPYSLDYVLTLQNENRDIVPTNNWLASMYRIRKLLELKVPELLPSFDEFNRMLKSQDRAQPRFWEPVDLKLVDVKDEAIEGRLVEIPANCKNGDTVSLIQAVIRQPPEASGSKQVIYVYMPEMFERLEKEAPLQLSFLLVHEWLWDFSRDVTRNRRINRFLHSQSFDQLSAADVRASLRAMGLDVETLPRVVDPQGSGHFRTLAEALASHRSAETLILKPGIYRESLLRISRPVRILGEGRPEETIIDTDDGARLGSDQVTLENLTLKRSFYEDPGIGDGWQAALEVLRGSVTLRQVHVDGGTHGIVLHKNTQADISQSRIISVQFAFWMEENASGRFYSNETYSNSAFQFYSSPKFLARVEIVGNIFHHRHGPYRGSCHPDSIERNNQSIHVGDRWPVRPNP